MNNDLDKILGKALKQASSRVITDSKLSLSKVKSPKKSNRAFMLTLTHFVNPPHGQHLRIISLQTRKISA